MGDATQRAPRADRRWTHPALARRESRRVPGGPGRDPARGPRVVRAARGDLAARQPRGGAARRAGDGRGRGRAVRRSLGRSGCARCRRSGRGRTGLGVAAPDDRHRRRGGSRSAGERHLRTGRRHGTGGGRACPRRCLAAFAHAWRSVAVAHPRHGKGGRVAGDARAGRDNGRCRDDAAPTSGKRRQRRPAGRAPSRGGARAHRLAGRHRRGAGDPPAGYRPDRGHGRRPRRRDPARGFAWRSPARRWRSRPRPPARRTGPADPAVGPADRRRDPDPSP